MVDLDDIKEGKDFGIDCLQQNMLYILKGCGLLDWGMQLWLVCIFNLYSNCMVMLVFDYGYFQGLIIGLECIDLLIVLLFVDIDVLMCICGVLCSQVLVVINKLVVFCVFGGNLILSEFFNECVVVVMEDVLWFNVCVVVVQVYIGSEYEYQLINNIIKLVDVGNCYGMLVLVVIGVGKEMICDVCYFLLVSWIVVEMGVQFVKIYFVEEGFEKVIVSCLVLIVIVGGKKLLEYEVLEMCWWVIDQGVFGVDMGCNIFQFSVLCVMFKVVKKVVYENLNVCEVYQFWQEEKQGELK